MRVHTQTVLQMTDDISVYIPVSDEWYEYSNSLPIYKMGGGSPDQTQVALENEELSFDTTLQGIFSNQYSNQAAQLKFLQGQLEPEITNPQGFTPAQLASQRTGATDTNAAQYQQAQEALNNEEVDASGGSKLTGVAGANVESNAQLLNAEAQTQAAAQENITQNNAVLQQSNYWSAINALNGVAAQENPLGYASASSQASSASSAASSANSQHISATSSPLMGALGGAFGGAGTAAGGIWCHVARAIYGHDSLEAWFIRLWIITAAPAWFRNFYRMYSERISKTPFKWVFYPLFEAVLARA
jgi:hypothetical protein